MFLEILSRCWWRRREYRLSRKRTCAMSPSDLVSLGPAGAAHERTTRSDCMCTQYNVYQQEQLEQDAKDIN
eukprot:3891565-Prymnesium_polylepis.1